MRCEMTQSFLYLLDQNKGSPKFQINREPIAKVYFIVTAFFISHDNTALFANITLDIK